MCLQKNWKNTHEAGCSIRESLWLGEQLKKSLAHVRFDKQNSCHLKNVHLFLIHSNDKLLINLVLYSQI